MSHMLEHQTSQTSQQRNSYIRKTSKESYNKNFDPNILFRLYSKQSTQLTQDTYSIARTRTFDSFFGIKECRYCNMNTSSSNSNSRCNLMHDSAIMSNLLQTAASRATIQQEFYNSKNINSILQNKQTRITSIFKDYLVYDNLSDYLVDYYDIQSAKQQLQQAVLKEQEKVRQQKSIAYTPNFYPLEYKQLMYRNQKNKRRHFEDQQKLIAHLRFKRNQQEQEAINQRNMQGGEVYLSLNAQKFENLLKSSLIHEYNFSSLGNSPRLMDQNNGITPIMIVNQNALLGGNTLIDPSPMVVQEVLNLLNGSNDDNDGKLQKTLSLSRFSSISQEMLTNSDCKNQYFNNNLLNPQFQIKDTQNQGKAKNNHNGKEEIDDFNGFDSPEEQNKNHRSISPNKKDLVDVIQKKQYKNNNDDYEGKKVEEEKEIVADFDFLNNSDNSNIHSFDLDGGEFDNIPQSQAQFSQQNQPSDSIKQQIGYIQTNQIKTISNKESDQNIQTQQIQNINKQVNNQDTRQLKQKQGTGNKINDLESKIKQRYQELDQRESIVLFNNRDQSPISSNIVNSSQSKQQLNIKTEKQLLKNKVHNQKIIAGIDGVNKLNLNNFKNQDPSSQILGIQEKLKKKLVINTQSVKAENQGTAFLSSVSGQQNGILNTISEDIQMFQMDDDDDQQQFMPIQTQTPALKDYDGMNRQQAYNNDQDNTPVQKIPKKTLKLKALNLNNNDYFSSSQSIVLKNVNSTESILMQSRNINPMSLNGMIDSERGGTAGGNGFNKFAASQFATSDRIQQLNQQSVKDTALDRDKVIRKNKITLGNIQMKSSKYSMGGSVIQTPNHHNNLSSNTSSSQIHANLPESLRQSQKFEFPLESARNTNSQAMFTEQPSMLSNIRQGNSRNRFNFNNQPQTVKHITQKFNVGNVDEISNGQHRQTYSIQSSVIMNNNVSGSMNSSAMNSHRKIDIQSLKAKQGGGIQKIIIPHKKQVVTLKKNLNLNSQSNIQNQLTQSVAMPSPSPYQQPFPVPIQGGLRKNRMDRSSATGGLTGLSPIRSRNHSYGGNIRGGITQGVLQLSGGLSLAHQNKGSGMIASSENSVYDRTNINEIKMPPISTPSHMRNKSQIHQKIEHIRNKSSARLLNNIISMGNNPQKDVDQQEINGDIAIQDQNNQFNSYQMRSSALQLNKPPMSKVGGGIPLPSSRNKKIRENLMQQQSNQQSKTRPHTSMDYL
eukprot:403374314